MLNKVILVGRLGSEPVLKIIGETTLCEMRLATEKNRGENKVTEWHSIKCFGTLAEQCSKFLKSGRMISVVGSISSKEVNGKRYYEIIAEEVQFL